jgi:hypothetical protein
MHKSVRRLSTFVLLIGSLVLLSAMPVFSNNNTTVTIAQGYNGEIVIIANSQQTTRNTSVEQVHLKASLLVLSNSVMQNIS